MEMKDILKWVVLAVLAWLAFRWAGGALSAWLSGGLNAGTNDGLYDAPYVAPLTGPQLVYGWSSPWQRGRGGWGRGRWGRGKRFGGPGPYGVSGVPTY
jgi:hypothetical protein